MKLINIFPLGNLGMHYTQDMHMFLTHLVEKYPFYAKFAKEVKGYKILDNSLIELGGAVDMKRVLDAAEKIGADEIILPDVFQQGPETINAVNEALSELNDRYANRKWPYKLMAVAQGRDEKEWYECYHELLNNPDIDVIGVPKVLAKAHPQGRPHFVNEHCDLKRKPHHLLGLWYSMSEFNEYDRIDDIRSCDTVLLGYLAKHGLNRAGTRPDGHTVDLEQDVINYDNYSDMDNLRRIRIK
jgi:hypothetical protein